MYVNGDIGDFTGTFGTVSNTLGDMGGIAAGMAGTGGASTNDLLNGSIVDVHATRIATILAGQVTSTTVTAANAPSLISNVTAHVIGADLNGNGVWDFVNDPNSPTLGFDLSSADQIIDGLVLGLKGRVNLGVTPLALITVPA